MSEQNAEFKNLIKKMLINYLDGLAETDVVEIEATNGIHEKEEDNGRLSHKPNGSKTIIIKINGGAQDTQESIMTKPTWPDYRTEAKQISHEMADEIIMQLLDIDRPVYAGAYLREKSKDYSDGYRDALRKCVEVARYVKDTYHPEVML